MYTYFRNKRIYLHSALIIMIIGVISTSCSTDDLFDGGDVVFNKMSTDYGDALRGNITYLIEPPEGSVMQRWTFTCQDFKLLYLDKINYINKEVFIVKSNGYLYIRGLSVIYPDAWIKGKIKGNKVTFKNGQKLLESQVGDITKELYFTPSRFEGFEFNGHTGYNTQISSTATNTDLVLYIDREVRLIRTNPDDWAKGFTLTPHANQSLITSDGHYLPTNESWDFKEVDLYPLVSFRKK